MTQAPIQDRVSPSGPLTGDAGPGGGLTPPTSQVAGDFYLPPDDTFFAKLGNTSVAPSPARSLTLYNEGSAVPSGDVSPLTPVGTEQALTAGTWLVKLELEAAYHTSPPTQGTGNAGVLNVTYELADEDGAGAITGGQLNNALPIASGANVGLSKTTVAFVVEISEEESLAANGFPRRRFVLERDDSTDATYTSTLTSTSGILELHKGSTVSITRLR